MRPKRNCPLFSPLCIKTDETDSRYIKTGEAREKHSLKDSSADSFIVFHSDNVSRCSLRFRQIQFLSL